VLWVAIIRGVDDATVQAKLFNYDQARREEGKGGSFPGPRDVWGAPPTLKNTEKGVPGGFFLTSNMHKIPRSCHGNYDTPDLKLDGEGRNPSPRFFPLDLGA